MGVLTPHILYLITAMFGWSLGIQTITLDHVQIENSHYNVVPNGKLTSEPSKLDDIIDALDKNLESALSSVESDESPMPLLDCEFEAGDICGFEPVQSQDHFYFTYSAHDARMVAASRDWTSLPWFREAYLYSPLLTAQLPHAVSSACMRISVRYQLQGSGSFLRVGIMPKAVSDPGIFHPDDSIFFANVTDVNQNLPILDDEWTTLKHVVPFPDEPFQVVFHAGFNFTSNQPPANVQLKNVLVSALFPCDENDNAKPPIPRPIAHPCSAFAHFEKQCRNGDCLQIERANGVWSEPFCKCSIEWSGNRCQEKNWPVTDFSEDLYNAITGINDASSSSVDVPPNITVSCRWDTMSLRVPALRLALTGLWMEDDNPPCLAEDKTCCLQKLPPKAGSVGLTYGLEFSFYKCGTSFELEDDVIIFKNGLLFEKSTGDLKLRGNFRLRRSPRHVRYNFFCKMSLMGSVSSAAVQAKDVVDESFFGLGDVPIALRLSSSSSTSGDSDSSVEVVLGERLAFEIVLPAPTPLVVNCRLSICSKGGDGRKACPSDDCSSRGLSQKRGRRSTMNVRDGDRSTTVVSPRIILKRPDSVENEVGDKRFWPVAEARINMTEPPSHDTPAVQSAALEQLVTYVAIAILITVIILLLIYVFILMAQIRHLRLRTRRQIERVLAAQGSIDGVSCKDLDTSDYWTQFRRILMGGRLGDSLYSEGGEFDVAYHEAEEKVKDDSSSANEGLVDATHQFIYDAGCRDQDDQASPPRTKSADRYQFPGSDMTRELYERRGVDCNNNE